MHLVSGVLGDALLSALSAARGEVLLVAPFIKASVAHRCLQAVPLGVAGRVVTRWRPEEVAAGVTDLEVLDTLKVRTGWQLMLCDDLHAKYFRIDDVVLCGSANLTSAALGWRNPSNRELLLEAPASSLDVSLFERELFENSVPATATVQEIVRAAAAQIALPMTSTSAGGEHAEEGEPARKNLQSWLPRARHPRDIAHAACNGLATLSEAAREQVAEDLGVLQIPPALQREAVEDFVRARLTQHGLVRQVGAFCLEPRRFGAVRDLVNDWMLRHQQTRDGTEAWQTLMRWLLHFLPSHFRLVTPHVSEVFRTVRPLD